LNKHINMLIILLILFLPVSRVNALELGQITLESYLNEPLDANFTLSHIETDHVDDVLISLADQDSYKSFGLIKPNILNNITFKISADTKNRYLVNISTRQRIIDPILDLLVKVTGKQGSVTRLYTLLLDPSEAVISNQVASSQKTTNHINTTSITDATPTEAQQDINQNQSDKPSPERIKVVNDSISMLAQNSEFHDKYSVYQIMRAYYLLNKFAFRNGNINQLKAGVTLIVPDEQLISELSRQKSIDFVYSVSKNYPFTKTEATQEKIATPDSDMTTPSVPTSELPEKDMADVEQQNAVTQEQSKTLQQSDNNLALKSNHNEIENQQFSAREDSSLPVMATDNQTLLNSNNNELNTSQQKIIIQQQADIEELKLTLNTKLDEIEDINRRLNDLELKNNNPSVVEPVSTAEIPGPPVIQAEPIKVGIRQESYSLAITSATAFIVLLFLLNRELIWRRRLKELDTYLKEPKKEAIKDGMPNELDHEEINHDSKTDNAINATPLEAGAGQNWTETDDSYTKTIVEEIHFPPVPEVIPDKADISKFDHQPVPDNSDNDNDSDIEINFDLDLPDLETDQTVEFNIVEDTEELNAESLEDLNLQLNDEKLQLAVSPETNDQNKDSDNLQPTVEVEVVDPQLLYSEIDVLIAYELYEEAFELIKQSRQNFVSDRGFLDIRELEILAYLKNAEVFFPMFEQLKESLSREYPLEWAKIIELSEQMTPPGPKLTAVF
jgi:FimV-like protein